jgi:dipeptidyl aminopeptidase/acylaminoacyl peptidase
MTPRIIVVAGALGLGLVGCVRPEPPPAPAAPTIEDLLHIRQAGPPTWAPHGREVAFAWGEGTELNLWVSTVSAPSPAHPGGATVRQMAPLAGRAGAVISPDWTTMAFVSKQHIWAVPLMGGLAVKLTVDEGKYTSLTWSPDSSRLAFVVDRKDQTDVGIVPAAGGAATFLAPSAQDEDSPIWAPDSSRLALIRRTPDWSGYQIWISQPDGRGARPLVAEHYERGVEEFQFEGNRHWSPDGRRLVYLSSRDGYNHLWVISIDGGEPTALTSGPSVDYDPQWSPVGDRILFVSSRTDVREERHVWVIDAAGGKPVRLSPDGFAASPSWSPDGSRIAYLRSSATEPPEVVVQQAQPGATPVRLTESRPDPAMTTGFVAPEAVSYPSRDGTMIPAILLRPRSSPDDGRRPGLLYFHGKGGINLAGWGGLPSYAFHQYLVQQGYAVLFVNWRGTHVGYGADFERANYRDYAGGELDDVVAGAAYLVREAGVDDRRIACWGGSYGGYMTMLAMTKAPDVFSAGISLYGVSDWATFLDQTKQRLWAVRLRAKLGDPAANPDLYERSAAIRFVSQARAPLLILQGADDDGVVPEQGESLYRALREQGKTAEFAIYTGEGHGFRHVGSLRDLYQRVESFLRRYNGPTPSGGR